MPHTVTISGKSRFAGVHTYYTKAEADSLHIKYLVPPLNFGHIRPTGGHVLTSNNFVVPILGTSVDNYGHRYYITPYGRTNVKSFAYCDGRSYIGKFGEIYTGSKEVRDLANMAYWHARKGDVTIAHRMAYGYEAPPDIDDIIRDQQYQFLLYSEFERMADEQGFPKGYIIEHRMKQTKAMTEVIEHIKDKILAGDEINPTHIDLFERCFKSQQENMSDLEIGYIRTPPDQLKTHLIEENYSRKTAELPVGGFRR